MIGLFLSYACPGLVMPTAMVLALDPFGKMAGLASSPGGTLQMLCGGLAIAGASPFFDSTVKPMVTAITLCGLCAFLLSRKAPSLSRVVPPQQLPV